MSDERNCKSCGRIGGTNKDCRECMALNVAAGAENVKPEDVEDIIRRAKDFERKAGKRAPAGLFARFRLLLLVLQDYWNGTYREMPWATIAAIAFAILYVFNPIDLVPDFIPVLGWLDDAAVVAIVWGAIEHDLRRYCAAKGLNPDEFGL